MLSPDRAEDFAFIETRLYWGGGLTASELAEFRGVTRQTAQGLITAYKRENPGAMWHNRVLRRQVATESFEPRYISRRPEAYLDYIRGQSMNALFREENEWSETPFQDVDRLVRPRLRPEPMQVLFAALREQRAVTMHYQSKQSAVLRDFSPNQLIFARNRYHIRGYCHVQNYFLDFVLTRITHASPSPTEWVSSRGDDEWQTPDTVRLKPNPALSADAIQAIKLDYPLDKDGTLTIPCRRALAFYVRAEMLEVDSQLGLPRWISFTPDGPQWSSESRV